MTYAKLLQELQKMKTGDLWWQDVTIKINDEYFKISDFVQETEDDVLNKGHMVLICESKE